jgi:hypothetical protein
MTDAPGSVIPSTATTSRLRSFVAWSLILHAGAVLAWGVPALLSQHAADRLEQTTKAWAKQLNTETVKAKSFAAEQLLARSRQRVDEQLRQQLSKLTQALPEAQREAVWSRVSEDLAKTRHAMAQALTDGKATQQGLHSLAAQLQRELVERLDHYLQAEAASAITTEFLGAVDQRMAPELAQSLRATVDREILNSVQQQANKLVAEQRDAARKQRQEASQAAREAWHLVRGARDDVRYARKTPADIAPRLAAAATCLDQAIAHTTDLDPTMGQSLTTAKDAVLVAQRVLAAADQPQDPTPPATAAISQAQTAVDAAIASLGKDDGREAFVRQAVKQTIDQHLRTSLEQTFAATFRSETLPRLKPTIANRLSAQLAAAGITDPALVEAVTTRATELLATRVPELAQIGGQVSTRFADFAPARLASTNAEMTQTSAAPSSPLGITLQEQQESLIATATRKMSEVNGRRNLEHQVGRTTNASSAPDEQATNVRERVGRLADGLRQGRIGHLQPLDLGTVRSEVLDRSRLVVHSPGVFSADAYREKATMIDQRGTVKGETWRLTDSVGAVSQAERTVATVPARSIGPAHTPLPTLSQAGPFTPTFPSIAFASAPCLPQDFTLDGTAEKWTGVPVITLNREWGNDASVQTMQVGWRADGLYLRFVVIDPDRRITKASAANFWESDTIETWVDCQNAKVTHRSRHTGQQFWVWPSGATDQPAVTGGEARIEKRGGQVEVSAFTSEQLPRVTTLTPTGWTVEFRLSPAILIDAELGPGRIIGLNAYVTTMAGTNWYWSAGKKANTWYQPDTWGDLLLAGSDGVLELSDATAPLVVGRPLRLRVRDSDMDLAPDHADRVMVTLRPSHGSEQIAILEETGPATGVFEGAVSTALALDDDQPGMLALYAGERIDVIYTDQARSNGARNAEVRLSSTVSSPVAARHRSP